jgi:hypothetical protein
MELKPPDSEFVRGDLLNLINYGSQYHAEHFDELDSAADLTLVLVIPCDCDELHRDLDHTGWQMRALGGGYAEIEGAGYATFVAFDDVVSEVENDDVLRIFSHHELKTPQARDWLKDKLGKGRVLQNRDGYAAMQQELARSLPPE